MLNNILLIIDMKIYLSFLIILYRSIYFLIKIIITPIINNLYSF